MTEAGISIQVESRPDPEALAQIERGLRLNDQQVDQPRNSRQVTVLLRSQEDKLIGGLVGHTYWNWFHILQLWVDPAHRGAGHAARLMQAGEAEAVRLGCEHAYLDTFTFQARPLYEKLGYRVFGTLDEYPPGHKLYFMRKYHIDTK